MALCRQVAVIAVIVVCSMIVTILGDDENDVKGKLLKDYLSNDEDQSYRWKEDGSTRKQIDDYVRPKYDPRWFTALSKIAKIRTADGRSWELNDDVRRNQVIVGSKQRIDNFLENRKKNDVHFRPRKFHCHPVQDIYVPKVEKSLPAYACKLGTRTFILTSERFLQDRRSHVDVSVDDSTFLQLSHVGTKSGNSEPEVIPAMLVLNKEKNDYGIRKT